MAALWINCRWNILWFMCSHAHTSPVERGRESETKSMDNSFAQLFDVHGGRWPESSFSLLFVRCFVDMWGGRILQSNTLLSNASEPCTSVTNIVLVQQCKLNQINGGHSIAKVNVKIATWFSNIIYLFIETITHTYTPISFFNFHSCHVTITSTLY